MDGILKKPFKLDQDGMLEIPNLPGLGIEIDKDKLALYTPDVSLFFKD